MSTAKPTGLKTEVLKFLRHAGCPVRHHKAVEILSREIGCRVSLEAYLGALDQLGRKVIRVRGANATAMAA